MRISKKKLARLIREAVLVEAMEEIVADALSTGDVEGAAAALHSEFGADAYAYFDEMRSFLAREKGIDTSLYRLVEDELYNLRKDSDPPGQIVSPSKGGLMDIIKRFEGKRIKSTYPNTPQEFEFPNERIAAQAVWVIADETGREAANSGNKVTVYK